MLSVNAKCRRDIWTTLSINRVTQKFSKISNLIALFPYIYILYIPEKVWQIIYCSIQNVILKIFFCVIITVSILSYVI